MRINKLTIDNFRSYKKRTTFDFSGSDNLNIILGQNGSGKTSFLSAIKYVLFGPRMFGSDYYTKEYVNFARSEINFDSNKNSFEVAIEYNDSEREIIIVRTSYLEDEYREELKIIIDGELQTNSSYLDTLNFNLFNNIFFNGENISLLTSSEKKLNDFLVEITDVYFEFDIFKQTIKDANLAINKELKNVSTNEYIKLSDERKRLDKKIASYQQSISSIENELETTKLKVSQVRADMKKRNLLSDKDARNIQAEIELLKKEQKMYSKKINHFLKVDAHTYLQRQLLSNISAKLKDSRSDRLEAITKLYSKLDDELVSDFTEISLDTEVKVITNKVYAINISENKDEYSGFTRKYQSITRKIEKAQKALADSKAGMQYIAFDANLEFLENNDVMLENNRMKIREKLDKKLVEHENLLMKIEEEQKKMLANELTRNAIKENETLIAICQEYLDIETKRVYTKLAKEMELLLNDYLLRKNNLVQRIEIDQERLKIIADNQSRAINSFSAGEQQLFLIALIFSVLNIANANVPLILDTFFARIDGSQQQNLIKTLNKYVTTQVLFIATDSELTPGKLKEFVGINKLYVLENEGFETFVKETDEN